MNVIAKWLGNLDRFESPYGVNVIAKWLGNLDRFESSGVSRNRGFEKSGVKL